MGIIKNILIPAVAIFVLGVLFVMNLLKPSPVVSPRPKLPAVINTPTENTKTEQTPITIDNTAPIPQEPLPAIRPQPLPRPTLPKTAEIKTPQPIVAPRPTTLPAPTLLPTPMTPAILPLLLEIPALIPIPPPTPSTVPPVNEDELMRSVVRIRCGNIFGSGFSVNSKGLVLSVAHVVIDAIEKGAETCDVIFSAKHPSFGFFYEAHYRKGVILMPQETKKLYKEQALDVAALQTSFLENDPVFQEIFPYINYPFCGPNTLEDKILLFGYAANLGTSPISPGSILSRFEGGVLQYEDITGVKTDYFPESNASADESIQHPITIIFSNNNFSGASGGLVFNISKNCIIGANSAVGTISGDPKVYGFIFNFNFPAVKTRIEPFFDK